MMRFYLLLVILLLIAFACKKNQEELKEKKIFVMAETSEMGKLMIEMYAYNESIKQQIINGELKNSYPQRFDNIHSCSINKSFGKGFKFRNIFNTIHRSTKTGF